MWCLVCEVDYDAIPVRRQPCDGCRIRTLGFQLPRPSYPWWFWRLVLLAVTFVTGVVAILGGVVGGVLFVPITVDFSRFIRTLSRCTDLLAAL